MYSCVTPEGFSVAMSVEDLLELLFSSQSTRKISASLQPYLTVLGIFYSEVVFAFRILGNWL